MSQTRLLAWAFGDCRCHGQNNIEDYDVFTIQWNDVFRILDFRAFLDFHDLSLVPVERRRDTFGTIGCFPPRIFSRIQCVPCETWKESVVSILGLEGEPRHVQLCKWVDSELGWARRNIRAKRGAGAPRYLQAGFYISFECSATLATYFDWYSDWHEYYAAYHSHQSPRLSIASTKSKTSKLRLTWISCKRVFRRKSHNSQFRKKLISIITNQNGRILLEIRAHKKS